MKKRSGIILLCLALIFSLMPFTVLAEEVNPAQTENQQEAEPEVVLCGDDLMWTVDDDVLTISGNGDMYDYSQEDPAPWNDEIEEITQIVIYEGVTSIGKNAFAGAGKVTEINLPEGIEKIGEDALKGCSSLETFYAEGDVAEIEGELFTDCPLVSVYGDADSNLIAYAKEYHIAVLDKNGNPPEEDVAESDPEMVEESAGPDAVEEDITEPETEEAATEAIEEDTTEAIVEEAATETIAEETTGAETVAEEVTTAAKEETAESVTEKAAEEVTEKEPEEAAEEVTEKETEKATEKETTAAPEEKPEPQAAGFVADQMEKEPLLSLQAADGTAKSVSFTTDVAAPLVVNNLNNNLRKYSSLTKTDSGYMRVCYDNQTGKIYIEYYSNDFKLQKRGTLELELEYWGGFYAGANAYYIVEGKSNTAEKDNAEVIRVIKFDKNWKRLGAASITGNTDSSMFGGEVRHPFQHGCVEMTENNGTLYIVTAHEGYVDEQYGQGHQGFLLIGVNESTLKGKILKADLYHSFEQYIDKDSNYMYILEQSEGGRCAKLSRISFDTVAGLKEIGYFDDDEEITILEYGGSRTSAWSIPCYASVDGVQVSGSNILTVGTSIDQSTYDAATGDTAHNIYLTITPKSNFTEAATTVKWLTKHSGDGASFLGLNLTKVSSNRFMVSWEEYGKTQTQSGYDSLTQYIRHYLFIDGNGNVVSKEFTAAAPVSDCKPIIVGSNAVYYASSSIMVDFYSINTSTGANKTVSLKGAGGNITWAVNKGVLTFKGKGPLVLDNEGHYRDTLSSVSGGYSYSSSDSDWELISSDVTKIVISNGITSIGANAINRFDNLKTVILGKNVTSLGDEAFYRNYYLTNIYIPKNVKTFGARVFETGYYMGGSDEPVIYVTISCEKDSPAHQYAKKNNISVRLVGISLNKTKATLLAGKTLQLKATATLPDPDDKAVSWKSSNTKVATVNSKGLVTAVAPGTAKITASSKDGSLSAACTITVAKDFSKTTVTLAKTSYGYTGKAISPAVTVKDGSTVLKKDTDYTVAYSNNKAVGTATVTVKGKGKYSGTVKKTFKIYPVGWYKTGGKWYYYNSSGKKLTGWQKISKKWYYLGTDGVMKTGWQKVSKKWYYLGTDGVMTTGWQKISKKWYYLGTDGVMTTGWQKVSGKWYYLGTNGVMTTGWQKVSKKWYYLGTNGVMTTGWQKVSGKWYYLGTDGVMTTGWQKVSGKWYYLGTDGVMVTGTQKIDGKTYTFDSGGVWVK